MCPEIHNQANISMASTTNVNRLNQYFSVEDQKDVMFHFMKLSTL